MNALCIMPVICAIVMAVLAASSTAFAESTYYEGKSDGWFWYEDPLLPEEPKQDEAPPPQPTVPAATAGPKPLSTEWIRENLPKALDAAIDNPTDENIQYYLYLQRYSMDKSEKFAKQVAFVTQSDPILDENTRNPVSSHAKKLANRNATKKTNELITKIAQRGALWFFYTSQCPYCKQLAPTLKSLTHQYGLQILPIALDGLPLAGGYFEQYRTDQGQAEKLNVTVTPTVYLAYPPDIFVPITYGVVSLSDIKDRIINAADAAEIITDEEYDRANAILVSQPVPMLNEIKTPTSNYERNSTALLEELKKLYGQPK